MSEIFLFVTRICSFLKKMKFLFLPVHMSSGNFESRIAALQNATNAGSNPLSQIATQMRHSAGDATTAPMQRTVDPEEFESFMAAAEASKGGFDVLAASHQQQQQQQHHHHHHHAHRRPQLSMSDSTMTPISDTDLAKKYRELKARKNFFLSTVFFASLKPLRAQVMYANLDAAARKLGAEKEAVVRDNRELKKQVAQKDQKIEDQRREIQQLRSAAELSKEKLIAFARQAKEDRETAVSEALKRQREELESLVMSQQHNEDTGAGKRIKI